MAEKTSEKTGTFEVKLKEDTIFIEDAKASQWEKYNINYQVHYRLVSLKNI